MEAIKCTRQAEGIWTASIRKLHRILSESQEVLLSVFHHQKEPPEVFCKKKYS